MFRSPEDQERIRSENLVPFHQVMTGTKEIVPQPDMVGKDENERIILTAADIDQLRNGDVLRIVFVDDYEYTVYVVLSND